MVLLVVCGFIFSVTRSITAAALANVGRAELRVVSHMNGQGNSALLGNNVDLVPEPTPMGLLDLIGGGMLWARSVLRSAGCTVFFRLWRFLKIKFQVSGREPEIFISSFPIDSQFEKIHALMRVVQLSLKGHILNVQSWKWRMANRK